MKSLYLQYKVRLNNLTTLVMSIGKKKVFNKNLSNRRQDHIQKSIFYDLLLLFHRFKDNSKYMLINISMLINIISYISRLEDKHNIITSKDEEKSL